MMTVTKNMVVAFRYVMKNSRGEVVENKMEASSKSYLHGSTGIQPALQLQFEGLKEGDTKTIYLKKENDQANDDFTFDVIIDKIRPALQQEIMLGYPVVTDNLFCDENCVCYDGES
jgi:hypothetical protein